MRRTCFSCGEATAMMPPGPVARASPDLRGSLTSCQPSPGSNTSDSGMSWATAGPARRRLANTLTMRRMVLFLVGPLLLASPQPFQRLGQDGATVPAIVAPLPHDELVIVAGELE